MKNIYVALDDRLASYSFENHPFRSQRYFAFKKALEKRNLIKFLKIVEAREATIEELLLFSTKDYIEFVKNKEMEGGSLDLGDTPVFKGIFSSSSIVVGTTLNCIDKAIEEDTKVFTPIGGLHHAFKDRASGFCVFNDVGVGINYVREKYAVKKILYFDIDAHHGDGIYYSFASDPEIFIVDFHQKGIFPGTGEEAEKGEGSAWGTKLNIELDSGSSDRDFFEKLEGAKGFLDKIKVDFIFMQAGCDCLSADPITSLNLTENVHREVIKILIKKANEETKGKMVIFGGGGYLLFNIKRGWVAVIEGLTNQTL